MQKRGATSECWQKQKADPKGLTKKKKKLKEERVHRVVSRAKDAQGMMTAGTQQLHRAITTHSCPERQEEGTAPVGEVGG